MSTVEQDTEMKLTEEIPLISITQAAATQLTQLLAQHRGKEASAETVVYVHDHDAGLPHRENLRGQVIDPDHGMGMFDIGRFCGRFGHCGLPSSYCIARRDALLA